MSYCYRVTAIEGLTIRCTADTVSIRWTGSLLYNTSFYMVMDFIAILESQIRNTYYFINDKGIFWTGRCRTSGLPI